MLIKYDKLGNIQWQRLLNSSAFHFFISYEITPNNISFNDNDLVISSPTNFGSISNIVIVKMPKTSPPDSVSCQLDIDGQTRFAKVTGINSILISNVTLTVTDISFPVTDSTIVSIGNATNLGTFHCDLNT